MSNKKDITVSVLDSETHQGDYISIEIKSDKRYIKSCYIKLILKITSQEHPEQNGEFVVCKIPVTTPRVYDIPIPISFPVSYEDEVRYTIRVEQDGKPVSSETVFIMAAHFVFDFLYSFERFFNFQESIIYTDLSSPERSIWIEFEHLGNGNRVDVMAALSFDEELKVLVCIAPGGIDEAGSWKKRMFKAGHLPLSSLFIKRKLDEIFDELAPDYDIYPEDVDREMEEALAMLEEANEKILMDDYDTAFRLMKQALQIKDLPDIHFELGKCMTDKDYPVQACISEFEKADDLDSEAYPLISGYIYMIEKFLMNSKLEKAVKLAHDAVKLQDKETFEIYQLGIMFKNYGVYQEAVTFIEKAIKQDKDNPIFLKDLADTYRLLKKYQEAEHYYLNAKDIKPDDTGAEILPGLACLYFEKGEIEKARKIAVELLNITENFDECGFNISSPDFTAVFDENLWQAYIQKYPQMKDVKEGKSTIFGEPFPPFDDFFV